jgi:hypothetical protein
MRHLTSFLPQEFLITEAQADYSLLLLIVHAIANEVIWPAEKYEALVSEFMETDRILFRADSEFSYSTNLWETGKGKS